MRVLHKWTAVAVALFVLAWLASGLLMMMPDGWFQTGAGRTRTSLRDHQTALRSAGISAAEVIAAVEKAAGKAATVTKVRVLPLRDSVAFAVTLTGGRTHLVDARTGRLVVLSAAAATAVAAQVVPDAAAIRTSLVTAAERSYWGTLPAYQVEFDDPWHTTVYVAVSSGRAEELNSLTRLRRFIVACHFLQPVRWVTGSDQIRQACLWLVTLASVGAVCSGMYLALPAGIRRALVGAAVYGRGKAARVAS